MPKFTLPFVRVAFSLLIAVAFEKAALSFSFAVQASMHSSTLTTAFLTLHQTMVGAKLRPPETLYVPGKEKLRPWAELLGRETQTMV